MPANTGKARVLITSALPYINGVKHLGTLVGSQLPADVYARFQRAKGRETMLICATDEHGTPAELAALEAGQSVELYCREQHEIQKDVGKRFGLSWDYFGRSSSQQNHRLTQEFARALWKNGHLEVRTTRQVYSKADGRFLPDRYVIGTCPHCGYDRARGDQCENCTRVLDPTDLVNPRSALSGSSDIEVRDSAHLFLKQSKFAGRLREWIDGKKDEWPALVTSIAYKWLDEGLQDRGITRDLNWGIPVPDDIAEGRLKGKVFYVWFDAPIEYIAATCEWADANGKGDEWRYVEFMGKDNIPFHTVGFPVTILGSGEPWKLVDELKGFNYINYEGGKFSTSGKRGVFMDTALEILPADYWRYYLMANAPEGSDSNFTWPHFAGVVNKDLADVLGNFVNRVTRFCASRFDGKVPEGGSYGADEKALIDDLDRRVAHYAEFMEQDLGSGQRISDQGGPLDADQNRSRPRRRERAHGPEPGAPFRPSLLAAHSHLGARDSQRGDGSARPHPLAGRTDGGIFERARTGCPRSPARTAVREDHGRATRRMGIPLRRRGIIYGTSDGRRFHPEEPNASSGLKRDL